MITKTNALKMSIKKWEGIVNGGQEKEALCGFCIFRRQLNPAPRCDKWCPLADAGLCIGDSSGIYSQWREERSIELAQRMLEGIKTVGQKWLNP